MIRLFIVIALNFAAVVKAASLLSAASDFLFFVGAACLFLLSIVDITFIRYLLKSQGKKELQNEGNATEEHY